ncbi:hypothetical protein [Pseudonocardia sp.]|uniref:hypothetical protein n=1 Tax=Pseudonocardia sp. TaxID=60912 RepID=UPI0031FCD38E
MIDADGCYVLPGLVDLHVHLDSGFGGDAGHAMLARAGVTTGEVVFHRGTVLPRRPRLHKTARASARSLGAATRIDPSASGLYTGAGR